MQRDDEPDADRMNNGAATSGSSTAGPAPAAPAPAAGPKFVTGSIRRHILVMASTGAVGLMAIFLSDLANILFLSMLKDVEIIAAVGYASSIVFVTISIGIGLAIAATSVVAPALGAGDRARARRLSAHAHLFTLIVSALLGLVVILAAPAMLAALGASGRTLQLAIDYVRISTLSLPALALGMTSSAVLRSVGDAKRAMYTTLAGAIVTVLIDPIFIFGFGWGLHGAALALALSRLAIMAIGFYAVVRVHDLMGPIEPQAIAADGRAIFAIALPAVATNVATPFGNAYVTAAIAPYGDDAVAGWAIIGRVLPVAFGAIYALTGSVGPVIGQNYGAGRRDRMIETLNESLLITAAFTIAAWLLLLALAGPIVATFSATGDAASLILLFCRWLAPMFLFAGALFVANAVFNTLGRPHWSTGLNWARATIGTIPFVEAGGWLAGAHGALAGNFVGGIAFGVVAILICYRLIDTLPLKAGSRPAA